MAGPGSLFGLYLTVPNLDQTITELENSVTKMPNMTQAVQQSTRVIQEAWQGMMTGATITYSGGTFTIHDRTGELRKSIHREFPYRDKLSGLIYSESEVMARVEKGYPAFDIKKGLLASSKAKTSKKGHRYITVPFRHNVPSADGIGAPMPQSIYNQAVKLDFSRTTGRNPFGEATYSWGGRLPANPFGQRTKLAIPNSGMQAPYEWKTGLYSGMVRMYDTATGNTGGYLTFRRVSERWYDKKGKPHGTDPNAWWHPGQPPKPITQAVIERTEKQVLSMIRTGAALDLAMAGLPIPDELG